MKVKAIDGCKVEEVDSLCSHGHPGKAMLSLQQIRNDMGVSIDRVSNELRDILDNTDGMISGSNAISRWERGVEICPCPGELIKALSAAYARLLQEKRRA